jgi:hypothetical protein
MASRKKIELAAKVQGLGIGFVGSGILLMTKISPSDKKLSTIAIALLGLGITTIVMSFTVLKVRDDEKI